MLYFNVMLYAKATNKEVSIKAVNTRRHVKSSISQNVLHRSVILQPPSYCHMFLMKLNAVVHEALRSS